MNASGAAASPDGLPPLGEVIRGLGLVGAQEPGPELHPRSQPDAAHRPRRRPARGPHGGRGRAGPRRAHARAVPGGRRARRRGGARRALPPGAGGHRRALSRPPRRCTTAMRCDADWRDARRRHAGAKPIIVANLPYNVATLLLIGWLESEPWPPWYARMVLMFQKEVAERIVAEPGTKAYGRLAVIAQWRTRPRLLFTVKPEAFTPPPSVASAVVEFTPIEQPRTGLPRRDAGRGDGRRLRPAPQDAAPEPALADRRTRRPCSPPPASPRRCAPRRSPCATSPGSPTCSSGWPTGRLARTSCARSECARPSQPASTPCTKASRPDWRSRFRRSAARMPQPAKLASRSALTMT